MIGLSFVCETYVPVQICICQEKQPGLLPKDKVQSLAPHGGHEVHF